MKVKLSLALCAVFFTSVEVSAQSRQYSTSTPRPTPVTRPELKRLIEDVKFRTPRIPLPELTEQDRLVLADRASSYESRVKYHFLGEEPSVRTQRGRGVSAYQDARMSLDYGFKVELFWVVSRTNNCQYCLGHQETKLLGAGRTEEQIASLDCDWSAFTSAEQTAFAFARKLTFEPHLLQESDFNDLEKHFSKLQILEMCLSMSWNNSINRWKEGIGVPQNPDEGGYSRLESLQDKTNDRGASDSSLPRGTYLTPTPLAFRMKPTMVASVSQDRIENGTLSETIASREVLEEPDIAFGKLQEVVQRKPRLPLISVEQTRTQLGFKEIEIQNWMRLLANFPEEGKRRGKSFIDAANASELSPLLQAKLRWIVARQDRAWYATAHAWKLLRDLTLTRTQIFELDGSYDEYTEREQALFTLAKNLAASPVILTDKQVSRAVELAGPTATVQVINFVSQLSAFDRITEAAALPFEYSIE